MKTSRLFICFIVLATLHLAHSQEENLSVIAEKYDQHYQQLQMGMAILQQSNSIIQSTSVGNYNFDEHTVFGIGSATKKITAILILQEEERGNLKLSDPLGNYLPSIPNVDNSITVEELLRHRSGLGELVGANYEAMYFATNDSIYQTDILTKIPEAIEGGRGIYTYCNTNYILLGQILEKVTGESYFDLVRNRIFKICKMDESYAYVSKNIPNLAIPTHHGQEVLEQLDSRFFSDYAYAAGSIASSLHDMLAFYNSLFVTKTLLSDTSIRKLVDFDDADYGLGMMTTNLNGIDYYTHGGSNLGYAFKEYYNPKNGDLLLYFANSEVIPFHEFMRDELLQKKSLIDFNDNISKEFGAYVGTYFFKEMNTEVSIIAEDRALYLVVQGMKILLTSHKPSVLNAVRFGISLEINSKTTDEIIFSQNGMKATLHRISKTSTALN